MNRIDLANSPTLISSAMARASGCFHAIVIALDSIPAQVERLPRYHSGRDCHVAFGQGCGSRSERNGKMTLSPGDKVDRYEVLELLGSGGMGDVYRARDPRLERDVALKILRVDRDQGLRLEQRLFREARAAAALSHPNVIAVHDVGSVLDGESAQGFAYIAMELVVGSTLRRYIGNESVGIDRRVSWLRDVASALGAAHAAGIVHRDVKPENIMIRADGVVKVLDFGIARRALGATADEPSADATQGRGSGASTLQTTARGVVVGTPQYMAPEQLRGEALDAHTDQFAWGIVAYELLTGKTPWPSAGDTESLVAAILSFDPPPPIEHNANIPPRISQAILRCLAKRGAHRFPSMTELLSALSQGADASSPLAKSDDAPANDRIQTESLRAKRPLLVRIIVAVAMLSCLAFLLAVARRATTVRQRPNPAPSATPVDTCTANAECVTKHGGAPWRCHNTRHECVELTSPDCEVDAEPNDLARDDIVWFGGLFPKDPQVGVSSEIHATELARKEFSFALGPSAARTDRLHARPIGLVLCTENRNYERVARHLADTVQVPAVIGFEYPVVARTIIPKIFVPDHIVSVVSLSEEPALLSIPEPPDEPRLIWHTTLNWSGISESLSAFITDRLEPRARSRPGGLGDRPMRVAVIDLARKYASDGILRVIRFNGKNALENGDNLRQFVLDSGDAGSTDALEALLNFAPQIIYPNSGADQWIPQILAAESRWRGPPPFYLVGYSFAPYVLDFIGTNTERRRRFFATTNVSSTATNLGLVSRFNRAYPQEAVTRTQAPQPSYDAFYLLAYATYAIGDEPVTGTALSRAITSRLLPPGLPVDVGPEGIYDAFRTLRTGGRIDLNGAIGRLDFDPSTGEAEIDYAILCCGTDEHGRATGSIESGLVYDAREKKIVGTMNCP